MTNYFATKFRFSEMKFMTFSITDFKNSIVMCVIRLKSCVGIKVFLELRKKLVLRRTKNVFPPENREQQCEKAILVKNC